MKNLLSNKLAVRVATPVAAVMLGTLTANLPAKAIELGSSITLTGGASITQEGTDYRIEFTSPGGIDTPATTSFGTQNSFSDFNPPLSNPPITIKDLVLSPLVAADPLNPLANYTTTTGVPKFIDFGTRELNGQTANLSFNLDTTQFFTNDFVSFSVPHATGTWVFGALWTAKGSIGTTTADNSSGYTISLTVDSERTPIPEPLTMGGLAVGAGFGAFLKKRYAKKEKQLQKA